nr:transcriptional regulator [Anaerolineae bacterium]
MSSNTMKHNRFFRAHRVFTHREFLDHLDSQGNAGDRTDQSILAYYKKTGRLISLRQGLYATIPSGADPNTYPVDPYLIATHLQPDAILSHHSALAFFGRAYSIQEMFIYTSNTPISTTRIRSRLYRGTRHPVSLCRHGRQTFDVQTVDHLGQWIQVTGLERAVVDMLNKPQLSGGLEEMWRSFEMIEILNTETVLTYVELLNNQTTSAKVGYVFEAHRDRWMIDEPVLNAVEALCPKQPRYWQRGKREGGELAARWNLIVPNNLANKRWEDLL